ncbi:hypothetical protein [Rhizobium ruizarguesonis]|uniref:hypothetical protein n=1 Tax=Rhizobium ruizarguesonis TaxID=2081791 RepID=UPI0013D72B6A|nr:hypothetical protein [Rhizobium ruizarguesonis]NEH79259.1 hypothetical protein [Rhizobium ruizarguesonis]NEI79982.1 hypothetical protein [Rhizobium ruizarguesonis]
MVTPPAIHFTNDRFAAESSFADVISAETFADVRQSARSGLLHLVMNIFRFRRDRTGLDLEATPDYLKRDLGFIDGRDPRCEDRFPL